MSQNNTNNSDAKNSFLTMAMLTTLQEHKGVMPIVYSVPVSMKGKSMNHALFSRNKTA